ncbi:hypothetical protein, conserved [Eimeria maxima]|uniref:Uncharacterized protein n=1 Tax=Eimeria maxima TaxID=5804 RepID=U6LX82_EIMMA|nr:hypothetical protein, conserved [Eimeria maxima]CDJ56527.1 hypothetical protein, conserved [Eimeria maxima]
MLVDSCSVSPDIMTDEPVGERRPLLLAALAEAIESERLVKEAVKSLRANTDGSISECQESLQRTLDEAFDLVRLLLARGASLSVPSERGVFPLEYAIKKHSLRAAALLLASPQCSDKRSRASFPLPSGLTPLHVASAANNVPLATLLLKEDASTELQASAVCQSCLGTAAVSVACTPPAPEGLRPLQSVHMTLPLCRACLVKARDERGCTAAFYCGSRPMLRLLLDSGSPLESRSSAGDTLLHALVYNARRFVDPVPASSVQEAIEHEQYEGTEAERSLITCRCMGCKGPHETPGGSALCRIMLLLQRVGSFSSGNPNPSDSRNSRKVTDFINTRNHAGWTALHLAASRGYSDVCKVRTLDAYEIQMYGTRLIDTWSSHRMVESS